MSQKEFNNNENLIEPILSTINQMLERDDGWKEYYISKMNSIKDTIKQSNIYEQLSEELIIEKLYNNQEYEKSCDLMQKFIDKWNLDDLDKGWFLQKLARYTYNINKEKSIAIQKKAFRINSQLLKPLTGIEYTKISYIHESKLNKIRKFISSYKNYIELSLEINSILDNLTFGISAEKFENALKLVGELLGFKSQRPDKEIRKGPDNLWCGSNNEYMFFECKSEVDSKRISISKTEAGQMNNHCAWFEEEYGSQIKPHRFMIIPTKTLSYEGNFTHEIRIIRKNGLKKLKDNIKNFITELKPYEISEISDETLQKLLDIHHLNVLDFDNIYSEQYYHSKK